MSETNNCACNGNGESCFRKDAHVAGMKPVTGDGRATILTTALSAGGRRRSASFPSISLRPESLLSSVFFNSLWSPFDQARRIILRAEPFLARLVLAIECLPANQIDVLSTLMPQPWHPRPARNRNRLLTPLLRRQAPPRNETPKRSLAYQE